MSTIQDTDLLLLNQGGRDYKITAKQYKEFVNSKPPLPWEEHVANGGVVFHVKDATGDVRLSGPMDAYELDGTYKGKIDTFRPGEELVILPDKVFLDELFAYNRTNWNFGELTDVRYAQYFTGMFAECVNFNGTGMSEWDVHRVSQMGGIFMEARTFNQDLSQWCVPSVDNRYFDLDADSWQADFKPCWGHCPRGEHGLGEDPCPGPPWLEGLEGSRKGIFHVIPKQWSYDVRLEWESQAYSLEGEDLGMVSVIATEMIIVTDETDGLFSGNSGSWTFGEHTDTRLVTDMDYMFRGCTQFNQDLSWWCVPRVLNPVMFSEGCSSWVLPKPVWGTCPKDEKKL